MRDKNCVKLTEDFLKRKFDESEYFADLESFADFKMLDRFAKDSVRYLVGQIYFGLCRQLQRCCKTSERNL